MTYECRPVSFLLSPIQTLQLHSDRVRSMCITGYGHVLSGPGSKDGHIAVWNSHLSQENADPIKEEDFFVV